MAAGSSSEPNTDPLCRLDPVLELCIRAWGKAGRFTFYAVSSRKTGKGRLDVLFKLRADESQQEATLIAENSKELVRSEGGLRTMTEPMRVFSTQEYDRTAEINHQHLQNNLERRYDEQFVWDFGNLTSSKPGRDKHIGISRRKNAGQQSAWLASILTMEISSSISLLFYDECLTTWQEAIVMMGVLKLIYCHFKLHTIPMPTKLPHLMPPGIPDSPMNCLQEITSVIFRMSCYNKDSQEIIEVLDSITNEVLLIQILVNNVLNFIDEFGQKIFSAVGRQELTVTSCDGNIIGTIEPGRIISASQKVAYDIFVTDPHQYSAPLTTSLCMYHSNNPTNCLVSFYLDNNHLYHCEGLGCLPNDVKALALSYGMQQVLFGEKVWKDVRFPIIDSYPFRPT